MVADAALGRAAAEVVLDAVAGEDLDAAVVHLHREVDGELAARLAQDLAQSRVEVEALGGQVELLLGDVPRVDAAPRPARWSWRAVPPFGRPGRGRPGPGSSPGRPHGAPPSCPRGACDAVGSKHREYSRRARRFVAVRLRPTLRTGSEGVHRPFGPFSGPFRPAHVGPSGPQVGPAPAQPQSGRCLSTAAPTAPGPRCGPDRRADEAGSRPGPGRSRRAPGGRARRGTPRRPG